jgi:hypothetical protein
MRSVGFGETAQPYWTLQLYRVRIAASNLNASGIEHYGKARFFLRYGEAEHFAAPGASLHGSGLDVP